MKPELRVYLTLDKLQRQFTAYLGSPVAGRGYMPTQGMRSLILEIAPGLAVERVMDAALKASANLEPGLLVVERQFGVLELHSHDEAELAAAGQAVLDSLGLKVGDQMRPEILFMDIVEALTDRQAVMVNRNKQASMVLPGDSLLLLETVPALFAAYAANEAEKVAPGIRLVDVRMIGATGRMYVAGRKEELQSALAHIRALFKRLPGRTGGAEP